MPEYFKTSLKKNKCVCTCFPNHDKNLTYFIFITQYHTEKNNCYIVTISSSPFISIKSNQT